MIYLAAGNSRRFLINGKQTNKLLQPVAGKPMYQYGLEQLKFVHAHIEESDIYVVTQYPEIYDACREDPDLTPIYSQESRKGISHSIRKALETAEADGENACYVFLAADQPFVRAATIEKFIRGFLGSGKKLGTVMCGNIPGNPTIFCRDYAEELKSLEGDQGGRKILKKYPDDVFEFQVDVQKEQQDVDTLSDLQKVCEQNEKKAARKIYVAGSGGKTSLIHCLADQYAKAGKKVLILTTTHMRKEPSMILCDGDPEKFEERIRRAFCRRSIVAAGRSADSPGKITWIGQEQYHRIELLANVILIEADGSKGLPAKFPNKKEPVILNDADEIYVVFGLSALDRKMKDACHRYPLACRIADAEARIDESVAAELLRQGYVQPLQKRHPDAELFLVLNQVDDKKMKGRAEKIAKLAGVHAIIISLHEENNRSIIEKDERL